MKGLLIKDFRYTIQNKRMVFMLLAIELIFLVFQGSDMASFVIGYMTMGCGMLVLSTISTDEYNKSMAFIMALPVSRKDYVAEKYAFTVLCNLFGWLVAVIPCCLMDWAHCREILLIGAVILEVMLLLQMAMLPAQLKYGGERGRVVLLGAFVCILLAIVFVRKLGSQFLEGNEGMRIWLAGLAADMERLDGSMAVIGLGILLAVCFCISLSFSGTIMEKKEF